MTAAGALVLLGGCGGAATGTTTATSSPATAKAEYVAKANAVCAAAAARTGKLLGEVEGATTAAMRAPSASAGTQLAVLVGHLHDGALTVLGQLEGLKAPAGEEAAVERFLQPLAHSIAGLGEAARAITGGHATRALGSLVELQAKTPQLASAAQAAGLSQCEGVLSGPSG